MCTIADKILKSFSYFKVSSLKENPTIRELFLGNNFFSEMDAKNVKHLLLNNSTLELLDLHCNELNDDCVRFICEGLAEQPASPGDGLKILNLSNNLITSRGMTFLIQALPFCRNLRAIDLSFNKIGNDGLQILANGLFERCTLLVLSLKACGITCEGKTFSLRIKWSIFNRFSKWKINPKFLIFSLSQVPVY